MNELISVIADKLNIKSKYIETTLNLLEEGNTLPFIARYRKEMTGGLDEEQIRFIDENYKYEVSLKKRKEDVIRLIETQGKITDEIIQEINGCTKLSQVEDIYRPYQQKRKTRATIAQAKGLKPLAMTILEARNNINIDEEVNKYVNEDVSYEEAIQGAKDIIAEIVSDDIKLREKIHTSISKFGTLITKKKAKAEDELNVYKMYYEYSERVSTVANHRILAIDRAENEKIIGVSIDFDDTYVVNYCKKKYLKRDNLTQNNIIIDAIEDGLKRLAFPSIERLVRNELTQSAAEGAIDVFSNNLERLLLQSPLKDKMILGLDPAYRTGCKLAIIDQTGKNISISKIYPHAPVNKWDESKKIIKDLIEKYEIQIVAIGNGTASRESEKLVAEAIGELDNKISYAMVSEAGASVYSASKLAISEFPDLAVEERSAISIARRIQDPLSELIKIDPQSIGVGQYQHDLPQSRLKERLNFVISKVVNKVGVDINTASYTLLSNISGLTLTSAKAIVSYRDKNGRFNKRDEILNVAKIGDKSYQQAAGFLRIKDGINPLDMTSIHPENYDAVSNIINNYNIDIKSLGCKETMETLKNIDINEVVDKFKLDEYTTRDIIENLKAPLRDYRDDLNKPLLRSDILKLEDLKENDQLTGTIRNVVDFGAFVDIGLKEDALIHISCFNKRIKHPSEIVSVGDIINCEVIKIEADKKKVSLRYVERT